MLSEAQYRGPVCRGCWTLGNNCKICERCIATKPTNPRPPMTDITHEALDPRILKPTQGEWEYDQVTGCCAAARIQALETSLAEARLQALEEAAKVADATMREEITGVQLGSSYRSGIRWAGERIKGAIRALASDPLLDRQGDGKEGV